MNLSGLPSFIQHSITTDQTGPDFKGIFRVTLIIVVLISVLIPVLIAVIRRHKEPR